MECFSFQDFTPSDRSNLINDAFNLARAGLLNYDVALDMTSYLDKEDVYLPWKSSQSGFSYIASMLEFTGDFELLQIPCYIFRPI